MDDIDPKEYCSIQPVFPKVAYIVFLFYGNSEKMLVYPMYQVFPDIQSIDEPIKKVLDHFQDQEGSIEIPDQAVIVPITYESKISLERKYWEGEHFHYPYHDRLHLFLQMLDKPDFYHLFIVPTTYDKISKSFELECALPIKIGSSIDREVENFLQHSDYSVDERAASVALYSIGKPMSYNFVTKKIDYPEILPKKSKENSTN